MNEPKEIYEKYLEANHEALEQFEEWILTQPHIPKNIPRPLLLKCFKVCKCDLEKAKKLLDKNVNFRIMHQYLFDRDLDSENFQRAMNTGACIGFPKLTNEKYDIVLFRFIDSDPKNCILKDLNIVNLAFQDMICITTPYTEGTIGIFDAKEFSFWHFMKYVSHIPTVIHFLQYEQDTVFIDCIQIHILNCSSVVTKFISFFKSFLNKRILDNLHFHSSGYETLHKYVDKECLPVEYGGTCGTLKEYFETNIENLYKHRDFITKNENFFLLNKN